MAATRSNTALKAEKERIGHYVDMYAGLFKNAAQSANTPYSIELQDHIANSIDIVIKKLKTDVNFSVDEIPKLVFTRTIEQMQSYGNNFALEAEISLQVGTAINNAKNKDDTSPISGHTKSELENVFVKNCETLKALHPFTSLENLIFDRMLNHTTGSFGMGRSQFRNFVDKIQKITTPLGLSKALNTILPQEKNITENEATTLFYTMVVEKERQSLLATIQGNLHPDTLREAVATEIIKQLISKNKGYVSIERNKQELATALVATQLFEEKSATVDIFVNLFSVASIQALKDNPENKITDKQTLKAYHDTIEESQRIAREKFSTLTADSIGSPGIASEAKLINSIIERLPRDIQIIAENIAIKPIQEKAEFKLDLDSYISPIKAVPKTPTTTPMSLKGNPYVLRANAEAAKQKAEHAKNVRVQAMKQLKNTISHSYLNSAHLTDLEKYIENLALNIQQTYVRDDANKITAFLQPLFLQDAVTLADLDPGLDTLGITRDSTVREQYTKPLMTIMKLLIQDAQFKIQVMVQPLEKDINYLLSSIQTAWPNEKDRTDLIQKIKDTYADIVTYFIKPTEQALLQLVMAKLSHMPEFQTELAHNPIPAAIRQEINDSTLDEADLEATELSPGIAPIHDNDEMENPILSSSRDPLADENLDESLEEIEQELESLLINQKRAAFRSIHPESITYQNPILEQARIALAATEEMRSNFFSAFTKITEAETKALTDQDSAALAQAHKQYSQIVTEAANLQSTLKSIAESIEFQPENNLQTQLDLLISAHFDIHQTLDEYSRLAQQTNLIQNKQSPEDAQKILVASDAVYNAVLRASGEKNRSVYTANLKAKQNIYYALYRSYQPIDNARQTEAGLLKTEQDIANKLTAIIQAETRFLSEETNPLDIETITSKYAVLAQQVTDLTSEIIELDANILESSSSDDDVELIELEKPLPRKELLFEKLEQALKEYLVCYRNLPDSPSKLTDAEAAGQYSTALLSLQKAFSTLAGAISEIYADNHELLKAIENNKQAHDINIARTNEMLTALIAAKPENEALLQSKVTAIPFSLTDENIELKQDPIEQQAIENRGSQISTPILSATNELDLKEELDEIEVNVLPAPSSVLESEEDSTLEQQTEENLGYPIPAAIMTESNEPDVDEELDATLANTTRPASALESEEDSTLEQQTEETIDSPTPAAIMTESNEQDIDEELEATLANTSTPASALESESESEEDSMLEQQSSNYPPLPPLPASAILNPSMNDGSQADQKEDIDQQNTQPPVTPSPLPPLPASFTVNPNPNAGIVLGIEPSTNDPDQKEGYNQQPPLPPIPTSPQPSLQQPLQPNTAADENELDELLKRIQAQLNRPVNGLLGSFNLLLHNVRETSVSDAKDDEKFNKAVHDLRYEKPSYERILRIFERHPNLDKFQDHPKAKPFLELRTLVNDIANTRYLGHSADVSKVIPATQNWNDVLAEDLRVDPDSSPKSLLRGGDYTNPDSVMTIDIHKDTQRVNVTYITGERKNENAAVYIEKIDSQVGLTSKMVKLPDHLDPVIILTNILAKEAQIDKQNPQYKELFKLVESYVDSHKRNKLTAGNCGGFIRDNLATLNGHHLDPLKIGAEFIKEYHNNTRADYIPRSQQVIDKSAAEHSRTKQFFNSAKSALLATKIPHKDLLEIAMSQLISLAKAQGGVFIDGRGNKRTPSIEIPNSQSRELTEALVLCGEVLKAKHGYRVTNYSDFKPEKKQIEAVRSFMQATPIFDALERRNIKVDISKPMVNKTTPISAPNVVNKPELGSLNHNEPLNSISAPLAPPSPLNSASHEPQQPVKSAAKSGALTINTQLAAANRSTQYGPSQSFKVNPTSPTLSPNSSSSPDSARNYSSDDEKEEKKASRTTIPPRPM